MKELIAAIQEQKERLRGIREILITKSYLNGCLNEYPIAGQLASDVKTVMGIPIKIDDEVNQFEIVLEGR